MLSASAASSGIDVRDAVTATTSALRLVLAHVMPW
jgi:hypothetical protein